MIVHMVVLPFCSVFYHDSFFWALNLIVLHLSLNLYLNLNHYFYVFLVQPFSVCQTTTKTEPVSLVWKTEKFPNRTSSQEMYQYFSWFTDYLLNQLLFFSKLIAYWSLIEIVISACLSIITVLLLIIATGYLNSHITRIM